SKKSYWILLEFRSKVVVVFYDGYWLLTNDEGLLYLNGCVCPLSTVCLLHLPWHAVGSCWGKGVLLLGWGFLSPKVWFFFLRQQQ
ncbi:MAG: hypothetical protein EXX96DRAFT_550399, partial [Benjaminiella poitrasii]